MLRHQYEQGRGDPAVDVRAEHERARLERKLAALEREKTRLLDTTWKVIGLTGKTGEDKRVTYRATEGPMFLITRVPETIANGMAKFRSVFCREEGFDHVSR